MSNAICTIIGVLIGIIGSGIVNYFLQHQQFKHNKEMFFLQNQGREKVKELLEELLNHRKFTDRTYVTIRKRIGGLDDNELRLILHEVGAKKSTNKKGDEVWYLKEREEERNTNISMKKK